MTDIDLRHFISERVQVLWEDGGVRGWLQSITFSEGTLELRMEEYILLPVGPFSEESSGSWTERLEECEVIHNSPGFVKIRGRHSGGMRCFVELKR
ncbi:MAG: hypothetical protein KDD66_08585 [Bdellovibrionales bacterium]|nr:hypothetical protein [Bdellovibrionales bacterium]